MTIKIETSISTKYTYSAEYDEGWLAFKNGISRPPHFYTDQQAAQWWYGWCEAEINQHIDFILIEKRNNHKPITNHRKETNSR